MFKKRNAFLISLILFVVFAFSACGTELQDHYFVEYEINAQQLYIDGKRISSSEHRALVREAGALVREIEEQISVVLPNSDVSMINRATELGEPIKVRSHTYRMLELCKDYYQTTRFQFTPALFALTDVWGFSPRFEGKYNLSRPEPSQDQIDIFYNYDYLELIGERSVVKGHKDLQIDLGGIAKGYVADCLRELVQKRYEGKTVEGSINVMSNLILMGKLHEKSGVRPWRIGMENPRARVSPYPQCMRISQLKDVSVATSSDMYRFYVYNDKIYSHIIDPDTCKPADNGIISITAIVPATVENCSAMADAVSTAGFCMPLTQNLEFYNDLNERYGVCAIVITADHRYYVVGDLEVSNLSDISGDYTDVFTRAQIEEASDAIENSAKEAEYIALFK